MPMTDASNQSIDPPTSMSNVTENESSNRRSQRRRTNVQTNMRSSSLTTTILNEANPLHENALETSKENDQNQVERRASPVITDKLVFTTSKTNPKSAHWTVTDRQADWYKLTIPVNQTSTASSSSTGANQSALTASYRSLPRPFERKKSNSNANDPTEEITDTTQLIMKAVMHELDYDLDDRDFQYLNELNEEKTKTQQRLIAEEDFENAMIILEYYTAEKIRLHLKQQLCEDENIVCDICLLPDADDGNEMVFCERCNACVHQNCYGISVVPSGTWLCKPCSILRRPACLLCPKFGGPMKCTPSGTVWCHLTCALWLPELKFADYAKMEPILNLDKIPHARWTLRCVVCSSSEGACVQCAHKNCRTPFHVTCGLSAGYFLDVQQTASKETTSSRSQFNAYCLKHSNEARQRSEPEMSSNDADATADCSSSIPFTVYHRQVLKNEQWLGQSLANFANFVSSSHLNEQCPQDYDLVLSEKIYRYWKEKRQKKNNLPLIPRIDFVLEQRENAELLLAQINHCLKLRRKIRQLQNYCKSTLYMPSVASSLSQRLENLKSHLFSSSADSELPSKRNLSAYYQHDKATYSPTTCLFSKEYYQLIENSKRCIVALETTYRDALELDTTYLIGQTMAGETMLLPKQLMEQANVITINENDLIEAAEEATQNILSDTHRSDDKDDNDDDDDNRPPSSSTMQGTFDMVKTPYACHGNLVTCMTGSFD